MHLPTLIDAGILDWVIYTYLFYLLFVVTMAAKAAWPILSIVPRVLLVPAALVAVVMDVIFNLIPATIIFLDPPRELLFTQRLDRYEAEDSGWRYTLALWICQNLLNPFQQGGHCTK
ncbi:MAG TPA: hypothetical protein VL968_07670 [Rhodocyclaceae bacterium]|nr:hypothetical protein [Rhodocyclaceae bacterium]